MSGYGLGVWSNLGMKPRDDYELRAWDMAEMGMLNMQHNVVSKVFRAVVYLAIVQADVCGSAMPR